MGELLGMLVTKSASENARGSKSASAGFKTVALLRNLGHRRSFEVGWVFTFAAACLQPRTYAKNCWPRQFHPSNPEETCVPRLTPKPSDYTTGSQAGEAHSRSPQKSKTDLNRDKSFKTPLLAYVGSKHGVKVN